MLPIHTILHPTDFSEPSQFALQMACALARDYGARLEILHVTQVPAAFYTEGVVAPPPLEDHVGELRQQLAELPVPADVQKNVHLEEGTPVEEIVQLAQSLPADLIVMGTHGRRGIPRLVMGSVAEQVLRRASCPVITVRAPVVAGQSVPAIAHELAVPQV